MTDTSDVDQNVRVSFQLSREAAIRLRELALTKRDLLCKLGVLAVKLGNESQICVTSGRPEFEKRTHRTNLEVSREYGREKYNRYGDAKKISKLNSTAGKRDFTNSAKEMVSVCPALAKATADSVIISEDVLPSVSLLNKESFMRGEGSSSLYERFDARRSEDSTGEYYGSINEDPLSVKSILKAKNVLKANTIDKNKQAREMPSINTTNSSELFTKTTLKANNVTLGNMVGKTNSTISNEEFSEADEVRDNIVMKNMDTSRKNVTRGQVTSHDMTRGTLKEDCGETDIFDNEEDIVERDDEILCKGKNDLSIDSSSINEEDNLSNMTDSFDCSTNNEFGSLPCHGISFAQHLINLSKQYRLENEKCGDKFFEASKIVKNDHVLRSFTTGNDKQEDFMGLPGQNSLLFGDNFSASTVKSAEELSKEHSEASPTNLDTMSEASADSYHSLFEDARLGSVHELSWSPSSNENIPVTISNGGQKILKKPSPAPVVKMPMADVQRPMKQEKPLKRAKYQRHIKGHSGIICKLCMHPVSKSYSCYKIAHAPKEIRHLFEDGSHCVRVCRRCLPYKSPKRNDKNSQKKKHKNNIKIAN